MDCRFFESFVIKLFDGYATINSHTTFNFAHADVNVANNCFKKFKDLLPDDWYSTDQFNFTLTVENKKLVRLLKNLRNRYFHFAVGGQRNIGTSDIRDPEFFFQQVNETFVSWFGLIYKKVIVSCLDNTTI